MGAERGDEGDVPAVVKKYANRRLYNIGTSAYVTLEDLAVMARAGREFVVRDAVSGEDITHAVLVQIIFDQESKGQGLLPTRFLLQLIRMYEGSVRTLVPSYLEMCLESLVREQGRFSRYLVAWSGMSLDAMREQVSRNLSTFGRAVSSIGPAAFPGGEGSQDSSGRERELRSDLDALERQVKELRLKLESLPSRAET